jgi:hypothetical protein
MVRRAARDVNTNGTWRTVRMTRCAAMSAFRKNLSKAETPAREIPKAEISNFKEARAVCGFL